LSINEYQLCELLAYRNNSLAGHGLPVMLFPYKDLSFNLVDILVIKVAEFPPPDAGQ
jgi:hypothetical protein